MKKKPEKVIVESLPTISAVDALAATAEGTTPVDWNALFEILWEEVRDARFGSSHCRRHDATLSENAWEQLKRVITETPLPVTLANTSFGFTVGMVIWQEAEEPYPGAFVPAEWLFTLDPHFLPNCPQASFDYAWDTLAPLVQREENIVLLKRSKLELPKPKVHYAY